MPQAIASWIDDDGRFLAHKYRDAKSFLNATAGAVGADLKTQFIAAASDARDLAAEHAQRFGEVIPPLFGEPPLDVDDEDATTEDEDDNRAGMLAAAFLHNGRRSVVSRFAKLAGAVLAGMAVADFAQSIGADTDADEHDIAEQMMSPVEGRAEMWIRTETSNVYSIGMMAIADETEKKRWATIDPGCEEICHPADGQVVDTDESFVMGNDDEVDYPPAHPNCDCTWLPWKEEWGQVGSTDELEAAA